MFNYFIFKEIMRFLRKNFKFIFVSIFIAIIILSFSKNIFAVTATPVDDLEFYYYEQQKNFQNKFVIFCLKPFINNTDFWNYDLKPIFDELTHNQYTLAVYGGNGSTSTVSWGVRLLTQGTLKDSINVASPISGESVPMRRFTYYNFPFYNVYFYPSSNSGSSSRTVMSADIYGQYTGVVSDMLVEFIKLIYGGSSTPDYTNLLTSINNYLYSIDSLTSDIMLELDDLSSVLSTISSNTSVNYSQQLSAISNNINNLLADNDTIISQNEDMIEQQEAINENLENVNSNLENLEDTITDTSVDDDSIFLPSDNTSDITSDGLNGIFTNIYNAFCTGQAQDIVFPIPFTNKNITLQSNYVRQMLQSNGSSWIITIIEAFWWYLISRFIIKDITSKITKIKSGNIESIENTNIKGDML